MNTPYERLPDATGLSDQFRSAAQAGDVWGLKGKGISMIQNAPSPSIQAITPTLGLK